MKLSGYLRGEPATLEQILNRREARVEEQRHLLHGGGRSLVSLTMNIVGAHKSFPLERAGFEEGLSELLRLLGPAVLRVERTDAVTGSEARLLLDEEPLRVKERCVLLEETHPLGRLLDIDVLLPSGEGVSRFALGLAARRCLLCGEDAKVCGRGEVHTREALLTHTIALLEGYFRDKTARRCAEHATRAVLYEVAVTPKPGLVDRSNNGSHCDMDFFTFVDSAAALSPWFEKFYQTGWEQSAGDPNRLFDLLRLAGLGAERAMFAATGGINTHKGLIFSMSILCCSLGQAHARSDTALFEEGPLPADELFGRCARLGESACRDFQRTASADTAGLRCYQSSGAQGARGEAASGFHTVRTVALPSLRRRLEEGYSLNDAAALVLLELIAKTTDTNMIHRGGAERAERCRIACGELLGEITPKTLRPLLERLDADYIRENLSPGGCADLLALCLFLHFLEKDKLLLC